MKSAKRGSATSGAEVVNVSVHGFWVFLDAENRELFLPFREFPWFADASIRELSRIEVERGHILRWPELDVDLDVARIDRPDRYPLVARDVRPRTRKAGRTRKATKRRRTTKTPQTRPRAKRRDAKGRSA